MTLPTNVMPSEHDRYDPSVILGISPPSARDGKHMSTLPIADGLEEDRYETAREANATEEAKMTDAIELPSVMHRVGMESEPWAIDAENLDALIKRGLAAFNLLCSGRITAGKIYRDGRKRQIARLKPRGNVGILSLGGPLLKYETWLSGALGMETYETLRHDLSVLLEEDRIKSVLLNVDTPGGEVNGCSEFAYAVHEARKTKPVCAYVSGQASGAGYWIASAAERIIASPSATVGPINVTVAGPKQQGYREGESRNEYFTAQAPGFADQQKPAIWGAFDHQKIVNDIAGVIVNSAAGYRGMDAGALADAIGYDRQLAGAAAVNAGIADEIASFDEVLARLQ
jgi:ClpP class serine protease